jgi:hypothetical protein
MHLHVAEVTAIRSNLDDVRKGGIHPAGTISKPIHQYVQDSQNCNH